MSLHKLKYLSIWSEDEQNLSSFFKALITTLDSPSNWQLCNPMSWAKITALLAAIICRQSTECGFFLFSQLVPLVPAPRSCVPWSRSQLHHFHRTMLHQSWPWNPLLEEGSIYTFVSVSPPYDRHRLTAPAALNFLQLLPLCSVVKSYHSTWLCSGDSRGTMPWSQIASPFRVLSHVSPQDPCMTHVLPPPHSPN